MRTRLFLKILIAVVGMVLLMPFAGSVSFAKATIPTKEPPAPVAAAPHAPSSQNQMFLPLINTVQVAAPAAAKKGVGLTYDDCQNATKINATWQYDWLPNPANCSGVENVPMIWGPSFVDSTLAGNSKYVMGFNEPDRSDQSNISPWTAATLWRQIEQKYPDRKLVSPAPSDGNPNWLVSFRNAYILAYGTAPRLDVLAMHCYLWTAAQCIQLAQTYEAWARAWGVTELWVTEFAFPTAGARSIDQALQEGQSFINWLEGESIVTRFAWFASVIKGTEPWAPPGYVAALVDWNTQQPTAYGKMYAPFR